MNNFYTLIYLIREWKRSLPGGYFTEALSFRKNTLTLYFEQSENQDRNPGNQSVMTFSSDPQRTALFKDRFQPPKRQNAATLFAVLSGVKLHSVELADADRFITFRFENNLRLLFLLYGNKSNVLLVNENEVLEAFKKDDDWVGSDIPEPRPASSLQNTSDDLAKSVFSLNPLLPRPVVRRWIATAFASDIRPDELTEKVQTFTESILEKAYPHIDEDYGFTIVDPKLLGSDEPRHFSSVNEGVAWRFYNIVRAQEFVSRKNLLVQKISRASVKINRSLEELSNLDKALIKADKFEENGHLLMSNPHLAAENGKVSVEDFYNQGEVREINVDDTVDLIQNANTYYQKARAARQSYKTAEQRILTLEKKSDVLAELRDLLNAVNYAKELDKWQRQNEEKLRQFGLTASTTGQSSLPYRPVTIGGYEIRIGKNARSNDELLRITHKEDIWLHARGFSGSHVIIVMNRKTTMPPSNIIESAAECAAFFSKGKGSSLVPVIFTKKKFVRKPKGAAPGAVKVDREDVVLVTPKQPDTSGIEST